LKGEDGRWKMEDGEEILDVGFWILNFGFLQPATCNSEL
jgi:hypothetical protein